MKLDTHVTPVQPILDAQQFRMEMKRRKKKNRGYVCFSLSVSFSLSRAQKKVAFQFFKASLTIETEQKPKIAGDWALMRSTTSLLTAENI